MSIERAYVMPHPPLAVPGIGDDDKGQIPHTLASCQKVAREIADIAPETIIYVAPHGIVYADYFHLIPGLSAHGDLARFGAPQVHISVDMDTELADTIARIATEAGIPTGAGCERRETLAHGVMVPMWFIDQHYRNYQAVCISHSGMDPTEHYRLGRCVSEAVAARGRKAVLVASGDLSHRLSEGGPYGFDPGGPLFDRKVTSALGSGDFLELFKITEKQRQDAGECGYRPLMVLAGCLDRREVQSELLSYEYPFGVGYAVARFIAGGVDESRAFLALNERHQASLARDKAATEDEYCTLARRSLEHMVTHGRHMKLDDTVPPEMLQDQAGVFVSLHIGDQLRGCIGTLAPTTESIAHEIVQNAVSAGLSDTRFQPVRASELPSLIYKVDVLSTPEDVESIDELDVRRYGVIVSNGLQRGLLLPDLEGVDTVEEQVAIARAKAGIPADVPVRLQRFEVIRHA